MCTLSPPQHSKLVHVERDLGFVELTSGHFDEQNSRNYYGQTGLKALIEDSSVIGFAQKAIGVCRCNWCDNTVFEAMSNGSREKEIVYHVSRGLK